MSDFSKVSPGQPLRIPAAAYNAMLDAAKAYANSQITSALRGVKSPRAESTIRFLNSTGAALHATQFVGLGDPITEYVSGYLSDFLANERVFDGVELVAATHENGRFGYVLQDTEDGKIGQAALSGIYPCRINVGTETDEYATIVDSQPDALDSSADATQIRIWWKESGTGDGLWGLVELLRGGAGGGAAPELTIVKAQSAGSAGLVSVKDVALNADPNTSPNYTTPGSAYNVTYFKE